MTHRTIHQQFRDAYRTAKSKGTIGLVIDWPQHEMGRTMNAPLVRVTPLMAERLVNLAVAIDYTGALFAEGLQQ
jgi:hypothetical protein